MAAEKTVPENAVVEAPLEWVDENNEPRGVLPRGEVHARGLRHRSVHVALFDARGRLYVHKRRETKSVLPNCWDISAAGHVEPGESWAAAARRELREELGVEADPLRPIQVTEARPETGQEFAALSWGLLPEGAEVSPDRDEIAEGEFLTPEELRAMLAAGERSLAPTLTHILRTLAERAAEVEPVAAWGAELAAGVRAAAVGHPDYPGDIPAHGPSTAALLAEFAAPAD